MRQEILRHLDLIRQPHLSRGLETLNAYQQKKFLAQLEKFPENLLADQRDALNQKKVRSCSDSFQPLYNFQISGSSSDKYLGEQLLSQGKVGCIILAGGQGTRLGQCQTKGLIPVSLIKNKSLFQLFLEKTLAASKKACCDLPIAIMTSPINFSTTFSFLEQAGWFGLSKKQVDLFQQGTLPFLDDLGNWILHAPGKIAEGPDGNGNFFKAFYDSGISQKWKDAGIEMINVVLIDNPLADPFDAELCGYHFRTAAQATIKCVRKFSSSEAVGSLVSHDGRPRVVEYSEFPIAKLHAKNEDGSLQFSLANTSLFCFMFNFLEELARSSDTYLPWHIVQKKIETKISTVIWKFERFIFDLLEYADRIEVIVFPREKTFSPLKNLSGEGCLEKVQSSLLASDRATFFEVTGISAPNRKFELDQTFYYPTAQFLEKWKGRPLPDAEYISSED